MSKAWYILQTYSQHEKRVEGYIRMLMQQKDMQEVIYSVLLPTEMVEVQQKKKKALREKQIWPGYIFIELDISGSRWKTIVSRIRRIPGVSGFIGGGWEQKPHPVLPEEIRRVLQTNEQHTVVKKFFVEFSEGEVIKVIDGPFSGFQGKVESVDYLKEFLKITVQIFGRETPVEVEFSQVEKI